jgi:hypothetical protein
MKPALLALLIIGTAAVVWHARQIVATNPQSPSARKKVRQNAAPAKSLAAASPDSPPRAATPVRQNAAPGEPLAAPVAAELQADRPGAFIGVVERGLSCRPDSQINVCATSTVARRCQVTDDGNFALEVPPGRYKVLAVCEQLIAEHVGLLDITPGERLVGLVLELRAQGVFGLKLELPPDADDEEIDIFSDPPSHEWTRMHEHHTPGGPLDLPIGPLPLGMVHLWSRGRCLSGDLHAALTMPGTVTRVTLPLVKIPCEPETR